MDMQTPLLAPCEDGLRPVNSVPIRLQFSSQHHTGARVPSYYVEPFLLTCTPYAVAERDQHRR